MGREKPPEPGGDGCVSSAGVEYYEAIKIRLTHRMMIALRHAATGIVAVFTLAACAPTTDFPDIDDKAAAGEVRKQQIAVIQNFLDTEARVARVAYPVLFHNAALCGTDTTYSLGISGWTTEQMDEEYRDIAKEEFEIGSALTVVNAAPDSSAERVDIRVGDKIASVDGEPLDDGEDAMEDLLEILDESNGKEVQLGIIRDGRARTVAVRPDWVCAFPVHWGLSDEVNAFADGDGIYVTTGFLRFVEDDDELAAVIGHELAHNTRGHIEAKRGNEFIGILLGALVSVAIGVDMTETGRAIGAYAYSQEFEAEADYVGVYHAARAGYDVRNAMKFWRRMAAENPHAIHLEGTTHPSTAKRFLAMEKAIEEVEEKQKKGLPLIPNEEQPASDVDGSEDNKL